MRQIIFALQFYRSSGDGPATAKSMRITTVIEPNGVTGALEAVEGQTAVMENTASLNKDKTLFFEQGTITFGDHVGKLTFRSIGTGYVLEKPDPSGKYTQGTVMWKIDGGEGYFAGAQGAITSNFLVDLETNELIDNHLYLLFLP